jgi:hypothetical protein
MCVYILHASPVCVPACAYMYIYIAHVGTCKHTRTHMHTNRQALTHTHTRVLPQGTWPAEADNRAVQANGPEARRTLCCVRGHRQTPFQGAHFLTLLLRFPLHHGLTRRVGQTRICTPYMAVCMVISLLKYRIYTEYAYVCMALASPIYTRSLYHGLTHMSACAFSTSSSVLCMSL